MSFKNPFPGFLKNSDTLCALALSFLTLILFLVLEVREPRYFLWDNNANVFLPCYCYNWQAVMEHHRIPMINFHQFCGVNYIGEGQNGIFYFPIYVGVFVAMGLLRNVFLSIEVLAILHFMAASVFMFLLLRRLRISRGVSFLGALLWISFPFIVFIARSWIFVSYTALFIPLNFHILQLFLEKPSLKTALLLAVIKMLFFFQGYVQYVHMLLILEGLYVLTLIIWKHRDQYKRLILLYLASVVFSLVLFSPQLLPMLKAKKLSYMRSASLSFEYCIYFAMTVTDFLKAMFFSFRDKVFCGASSQIFYTAFPLYLIFLYLVRKGAHAQFKKEGGWLFTGLALFSLLMTTKCYGLFYHLIPGFSVFKGQFKHFIFFLFFLTIAACLSAETAFTGSRKAASKLIYAFLVVSLLLNCATLFTPQHVLLSADRVDALPGKYQSVFSGTTAGRILTLYVKDVPLEKAYTFFMWDYATFFNLSHFRGYPFPLLSRMNMKYCLDFLPYEGGLNDKFLNYLSFWGVRYLVTRNLPPQREKIEAFPSLKLRYEDDDLRVYENLNALPLVSEKNNPRREVPFSFGINEIYIYPGDNSTGDILLSIVPLEGYQYSCDSNKPQALQADAIPVTLAVPEGTRKIVVKYRDSSLLPGIEIFLGFWTLVILYSLIKVFREPVAYFFYKKPERQD